MEKKIYDMAGIGIGPFNLGLAALIEPLEDLEAIFFEQNTEFQWHPGMLLEGTVLNSSFLADLVTFADPTSPYTVLNYLHKHNRLFQFYFYKKMNIPRREYNSYTRWVASQLPSCNFGSRVIDVIDHPEKGCYEIVIQNVENKERNVIFAKHIVIGTGSTPLFPPGIEEKLNDDIIHTSSYAYKQNDLKDSESITIVGSGQSAAEIFLDLLQDQKYFDYSLAWMTRSNQFFQSESAKLAREVFSPDYVRYFRGLDFEKRMDALPALDQGRKGIEQDTLINIYDLLYHRSVEREDPKVILQAMTELQDVEQKGKNYEISFIQWQSGENFRHHSNKVVLATGYKPGVPEWLNKFKPLIEWENESHYKVNEKYRLEFKKHRPHRIYMLTGLDHSHATAATNLALSVLRNQTIINDISGHDVYPLQKDVIFQQFQPKKD
ncbi:lysine N(6)-hydroxylase/L-ornithine N(5)-oxygenase family protein [Alteribacillus sp. HJP-4]|uniref:lysine N(6)-hydroxylase/L-ornithine N(5)-oxygenase family protein n=1 Tax=Alteribacillus sp. HJP-4 TaxID=2775394 RepID=UPI0035CD0B82